MRFHEYPAKEWTQILPGAAMEVMDFVRQTVCYESTWRLTADQVSGQAVRSLNCLPTNVGHKACSLIACMRRGVLPISCVEFGITRYSAYIDLECLLELIDQVE